MKIALYCRPTLAEHAEDWTELLTELERNGLDWCAHEVFAGIAFERSGRRIPSGRIYSGPPPEEVDLLVGLGGDGTFLDCVRLLDTRPVPVLGINYGRLGFLANVSHGETAEAARAIAAGEYTACERLLVEVTGDFGTPVDYPYAFNEFGLQKSGTDMVSVTVWIDGQQAATVAGDGVLLSTPSGSTAYALSLGGPILAPDCRCLEVAPIAPHNLAMRPLVVPEGSELRFRVTSRTGTALATLDSRAWPVASGSEFTVRKARKSAFSVELHGGSFYRTLRDKLMWGLEPREIPK